MNPQRFKQRAVEVVIGICLIIIAGIFWILVSMLNDA